MIPSYANTMHAAVRNAISLRLYQQNLANGARAAWDRGVKNIMIVLATGGGKTAVMGDIVLHHKGASCIGAHRQELVGQISVALARCGVRHRIIAPEKVIKSIQRAHIEDVGTSFIWAKAPTAVAGVDTLVRRGKLVPDEWLKTVTLCAFDEGHHVTEENKWGRCYKLFTHKDRKLLTVTATPIRADGQGLGTKELGGCGLVQEMIVGPCSRELIDWGYLCDYRVVLAKSDVNLIAEHFSKATGELNEAGKALVRESHIVGDVVERYMEHSPGERALAFYTDVETSIKGAAQFRLWGVRAMHIDGDSDDDVRMDAVRKLKNGELDVLCNVGLFGEGFDLPAVKAVYDAAATESFSSYSQRFGRMLRLSVAPELIARWETFTPEQRHAFIAQSSKPFGLYVDLVGNMVRHRGPPDKPREWTLESREKRGGGSAGVPLITFCTNPTGGIAGFACGKNYERYLSCCPYCGYKPVPAARSTPEQVDGDFTEMDSGALAALFAGMYDLDQPFVAPYAAHHIQLAAHSNYVDKHAAQTFLRECFAWWAGEQRATGLKDNEINKKFYLTFRVDIATACSYSKKDADILSSRIEEVLTASSRQGIVRPQGY